MKISISVPTYNRFENLLILSKCFQHVKHIEKHHLRIYDDESTTFSLHEIQKVFPSAKQIIRNVRNLGADRNLYSLMVDFLKSDDDVLFVCDSDLIMHPECLWFIENTIDKTEGIMSVYNSARHPSYDIADNDFLLKKSIGAAGSVFTRKMIEQVIQAVPEKFANYWDWAISFYLQSISKKIYVSKQSFVQHIGIKGENNTILSLDYGINYQPQTALEKEQLSDFYKVFFQQYTSISPAHIGIHYLRRKVVKKIHEMIFALFGYRFVLTVLTLRKKQKKSIETENVLN